MKHIEQKQGEDRENNLTANVGEKADQPQGKHIGIKTEDLFCFHNQANLL